MHLRVHITFYHYAYDLRRQGGGDARRAIRDKSGLVFKYLVLE